MKNRNTRLVGGGSTNVFKVEITSNSQLYNQSKFQKKIENEITSELSSLMILILVDMIPLKSTMPYFIENIQNIRLVKVEKDKNTVFTYEIPFYVTESVDRKTTRYLLKIFYDAIESKKFAEAFENSKEQHHLFSDTKVKFYREPDEIIVPSKPIPTTPTSVRSEDKSEKTAKDTYFRKNNTKKLKNQMLFDALKKRNQIYLFIKSLPYT